MPMTAPSAAGFSRKALTGCNPRLVRPSQVHTRRLPSTQYSWFAQRFQILMAGHQRFMTVSSWALPPYAVGPAIRQHAHALVRRRHATGRPTARRRRPVLPCMARRFMAGRRSWRAVVRGRAVRGGAVRGGAHRRARRGAESCHPDWPRAGATRMAAGRVCSRGAVGPVSAAVGSSVDADAPLAQSAERLHGKEKVYGSIP
jgi:hypothetical protein